VKNGVFMKRILLLVACITFIGACTEDPANDSSSLGPSETFLKYHLISQSNKDFSVEESYQTQAKRDELRVKLPQYISSMKVDNVEQVKEKYLMFIGNTAKCTSLTLTTETIAADKAQLAYAVEDTCSGHTGAIQKVEMHFERGGWKIHDTELVL